MTLGTPQDVTLQELLGRERRLPVDVRVAGRLQQPMAFAKRNVQ